ncbi:MAG: hypothetical protein ACJ8DZ_11875 [Allosphingosinicella sp.]
MDLEPRQLLWLAAALLLGLAVVAALAEHRRQRRRDVDRPGLVPWNAVQIFAFLLAVIAATLALKAG